MCEIEHTLHGDTDAKVEVGESFGIGFYVALTGNDTSICVFLEFEQMEELFGELKKWLVEDG